MTILKPGESIQCIVKAHCKRNKPGIKLLKGATYNIFVDPIEQTWVDGRGKFRNEVTASGYSKFYLKPFFLLKRYKRANWFALIGAIKGEQSYDFLIGESRLNFKPTVDGELVLFANDALSMYWNNSGELSITITREE